MTDCYLQPCNLISINLKSSFVILIALSFTHCGAHKKIQIIFVTVNWPIKTEITKNSWL